MSTILCNMAVGAIMGTYPRRAVLIGVAWILIVASLGCGGRGVTGPDDPTPRIYWHGATTDEVTLGERLWHETAACAGVRDDLLAPLDVTVLPEAFYCGTVFAAGCTDTAPLKIRVARQYFAAALPHEFLNAIWAKQGHLFVATPENPYSDDWRLVNGGAWAKCDPNTGVK